MKPTPDSAQIRRLRRLYSDQDISSVDQISLSPEESQHALKSLRIQPGESCLIVNGQGWEAEAVLRSVQNDLAIFEIVACRREERGFPVKVVVLPAFIKKGKMDTLVEKAQEFGAAIFKPLICERSEYEVPLDRFDSVAARWGKIAKEAAKQSGASRAIEIQQPVKFEKILSGFEPDSLVLIFHTQSPAQASAEIARDLSAKDKSFSAIYVLIGPEGGFSQKEIQSALTCQNVCVKCVSMGNTVLKADTAFIAALAHASFFI